MSLPRPLPHDLIAVVVRGLLAVADPRRLQLIETLDRVGPRNVQSIADELGISQQNTSKHLGVLLAAGLVARRREGRVVWYAVAGDDVYLITEQAATMILNHLP